MFQRYNPKLRQASRVLRNNQTEAEKEFWKFLKDNYIDYKFNRQRPIDNFIVDFHCLRLNLVIEIDGEIHEKQKERDKERDDILKYKYNLKTIRFTNDQVISDKLYLKKVLDEVLHS